MTLFLIWSGSWFFSTKIFRSLVFSFEKYLCYLILTIYDCNARINSIFSSFSGELGSFLEFCYS